MQGMKKLSIFSLVMINVIAVDNLRTLPISAKLGPALILYYLVAAFVFFIPAALIAAELATAYPQKGGIYIWIREAFGPRLAFVSIWLQWLYNVVWYPTILAFIASALSYLFAPELANNKIYLLVTCLSLFWLFTILNCFGMRLSSLVSILGATIGTIIPMVGISILGGLWLYQGYPLSVDFTVSSWLPDLKNLNTLPLFAAVLFGLLGVEMSAVHADEVKNPRRDYPKAIMYSVIIIFTTLVCGSLAIVIVVPLQKLSMVSGLVDAYAIFFNNFNLSWLLPIVVLLIIFGGISGVSAWIIGPTKGLLVSAQDGSLPKFFTKVNSHGAPVNILFIQGLIFTCLSLVFIFSDNINAAYWLLSDLCAQMALIVYIFMFSAAIKLRYTKTRLAQSYSIPGGNVVMWLVAGVGILCCLFAIIIGFIPPEQVAINNLMFFESFLFGGLIIFMVIPWFLAKKSYLK